MKYYYYITLVSMLLISSCTTLGLKKSKYDYSKMDRATKLAHYKVERFLNNCIEDGDPVQLPRYAGIDSVRVDRETNHINIYFNRFVSYIPFREENTTAIYDDLHYILGRRFASYSLSAYSQIFAIEELIPNYYRGDTFKADRLRRAKTLERDVPLVRRVSNAWNPDKGLYNKNIALWHSHGWYFEQKLNRWEWQRARLFQAVEDLGPMAFTIPYLIPMLENAGANVFTPRERDLQVNEVIVDNDSASHISGRYVESASGWETGPEPGFAVGTTPYTEGINPFRLGSYRRAKTTPDASTKIQWIPDIPETGSYAVYISYFSSDSNACDAHYSVHHSGGNTKFLINQEMGGGTWIYLGTFKFKKGSNPEIAQVVLSNKSKSSGKYVSADAVRFGGGMGNVKRGESVSGRPRFAEGARYYLQYAGMPDTLVYSFNHGESDYKDDYQSRGEWVNYLKGKPFGPNKDREIAGLGIPVDLSLAFHTDAGISSNDTVIGTLSIYSTWDADSALSFPNDESRLANRDFADIMQTQIVDDIRQKYDPVWTRRGLWDRQYSEAYRPNVPAALLELLSHQNFLDMKFALDPRYRFDVSRAIYKAMLRFIADRNQTPCVVQPLPVTHFQAVLTGEKNVILRWQPQADPLEPTAKAEKYIVYQRIENNEFNNGILVSGLEYEVKNLKPGIIHSFQVTAVNDGGESFPSEVLSVCRQNNSEPVLIVNGFDRISGPTGITRNKFAGFADFIDMGVPDKYDLGYTGRQFNFDPKSPWKDDDAPGFGSSYANFETKIIPGNTFDFTYIHGKALRSAGLNFVSVSDEVILDKQIDITNYTFVDLILGEEKQTPGPKPFLPDEFEAFPVELRNELNRFCTNGGNLFVSGAYIGTDLFNRTPADTSAIGFAKETLKFFWRTNHAVAEGSFMEWTVPFGKIRENLSLTPDIIRKFIGSKAPDAIEPVDSTASTLLRYSENNMSAAVGYRGKYKIVSMGFPFEAIISEQQRTDVMKMIVSYFKY